ncbi:hypothetical protein ACVWYH_000886 [Bradyrhizobium sp. GM24.11]
MSKGPGRIQRAIEAAFAKSPSDTFTVEELGPIAYPGLNRIEKKHRVAILRAAYAALERTGWGAFTSERPGGHIVFFNWSDVRSYAIARMRADFVYNRASVPEIIAELDDPKDRYYKMVRPGGSWWLHVELEKAKRSGDERKIAKLQKQNDENEAGIRRALGG